MPYSGGLGQCLIRELKADKQLEVAQHVTAPDGMFNDVGRDQINDVGGDKSHHEHHNVTNITNVTYNVMNVPAVDDSPHPVILGVICFLLALVISKYVGIIQFHIYFSHTHLLLAWSIEGVC